MDVETDGTQSYFAMSIEPSAKDTPLLGSVLVTGGCGFLGFHLVSSLVADPDCGPVYVLDIDTTTNTHPDATYFKGSVTDAPHLLSNFLDTIQPTVIFHAASPSATYAPPSSFHATNVDGTHSLLRLAKEKPFIQALVYTSSLDVYADPPLHHVPETYPLWPDHPRPWRGLSEYDRTKTIAHKLVLAANCPPALKTAVIVPSHIWGLRDRQGLSLFFDTFADPRRPLWQVGPGRNVNSCVEAGNCAAAHILAAKALVDHHQDARVRSGRRVDGEAFNVTDGEDVNFWDDIRVTCAMIRGCYGKGGAAMPKFHVLPPWTMRLLVWLVKWILLILTLGFREPSQALSRNGCSWATEDHTLDDTKAREVLGYRPRQIDREELLLKAVEFERQRRRAVAEGKLD